MHVLGLKRSKIIIIIFSLFKELCRYIYVIRNRSLKAYLFVLNYYLIVNVFVIILKKQIMRWMPILLFFYISLYHTLVKY